MKTPVEKRCQKMEQYFPSYLDGELNPKEKQIIELHFQDCEGCKKKFQEYGRAYKQIKSGLRSLLPKGEKLKEKLKPFLQEQTSPIAVSVEEEIQDIKIQGFRILSLIGQGSMGRVYKAIQISLGRTVALKVLSPQHAGNENYIRRFLREAKSAAKLNHPHIIQVYDVGQEGDIYYIAMEYVEGKTVGQMLREQGKLEISYALDIGIQIARALAHAEKAKIVHRDIKPENILINENNIARLADLGMAKKVIEVDKEMSGQSDEVFLTQGGTIMGTPEYMSPEQITHSKKVNHLADIYSLGATLFHMITGRPPFEGETMMEVFSNVLHEPLSFHPQERKLIPQEVRRVIQKMMAKNPHERYSSAEEVVRALTEARNRHSSLLISSESSLLTVLRGDTTSIQIVSKPTEGSVKSKTGSKKAKSDGKLFYIFLILLGLSLFTTAYLFFVKNGGEREYQKVWTQFTSQKISMEEFKKRMGKLAQKYGHNSLGLKAKLKLLEIESLEEKQILLDLSRLLIENQLYKAEKIAKILARKIKFQRETKGVEKLIGAQEIYQLLHQRRTREIRKRMMILESTKNFLKAKKALQEIERMGSSQDYQEGLQLFEKNKPSYNKL